MSEEVTAGYVMFCVFSAFAVASVLSYITSSVALTLAGFFGWLAGCVAGVTVYAIAKKGGRRYAKGTSTRAAGKGVASKNSG